MKKITINIPTKTPDFYEFNEQTLDAYVAVFYDLLYEVKDGEPSPKTPEDYLRLLRVAEQTLVQFSNYFSIYKQFAEEQIEATGLPELNVSQMEMLASRQRPQG